MSRSLWIALALIIGLALPVAAQEEEPRQVIAQQPASPQTLINMRGFSSDYEVGPGDLLDIQVIGHEDLKQSLRVSNSGEINVSMLGLIRVIDLTTFEIEDDLARRFKEANLVLEPEVLVAVQEFQAKPIYVMGAVAAPGEFIMSQALTVVDAVLLAGGLRFNAADEAYLYRRGVTAAGATASPAALAANPGVNRPGVEVVPIDLKPLKSGRFNESQLPLRRGDVLVVPNMVLEQFFVVGDVLEPRNYMYTPGKPLMASQAISWAGGPTPTSKMSDGMLVRFDQEGNRIEKKVDWGAIINGKQPDFQIEPNDIIFVPGSTVKTITHGLLLLSGNMVQNAAFRIGRTYQMPDAPPRTAPPQQQ